MDWDDIRYFLAAARASSLGGAARALDVDASTVGRRIAALEATLGTPLLVRGREGLRLTRAGERVRAQAERVEAEVRGVATAPLDEQTVGGLVRVATTEVLASYLVERGLFQLALEHPTLAIDIVTGNAAVDLERGEADLALRLVRSTNATVRVRKIADLRFAAYASAAYLARRGTPRDLAGLAGHDVVVPSAELHTLPEARLLHKCPDVRMILQSNSMAALTAGMHQGLGIGLMPREWAERDGRLQWLFDVDELPPRSVWLATSPLSVERAAVRAVADRITALVRR